MSSKTMIMILMTVGSIVGGYVPALFGAGAFSFWSLFTSAAGAIAGIWLGYKISQGR